MQIVIDISEDDYRKVQDGRASVSMMQKAIRNGTPLTEKLAKAKSEIRYGESKAYNADFTAGCEYAIGVIEKMLEGAEE
jgi:hypothetical protein